MFFSRKTLARAALSVAGLCASLPAWAWPDRPVELVVGFAPGGGTDLTARALAVFLEKELGTTVVVQNKPGASSAIALSYVARAKPDGYTLLSANNGVLVIQAAGRETPPYDPTRQLTPIMKVVDAIQFMGISSDLPARTVGEFIALLKQNPGKYNFSSAGIGSFGHFLGEYF